MRICLLTNNTRNDNGWGRFARELVLALRAQGADVAVLSEEGGGLPDEHVVLRHSLRFALTGSWKVLLHACILLRNALCARAYFKQCDVVHALDGYPYGALAWLGLWGLKKPMLLTLQGTYTLDAFNYPLEKYLLRRAVQGAKRVVCISSYTEREFRARMEGVETRIIGHGTSALWLSAPKSLVAPPMPSPYILSVGAVKPQKGYTVSVQAFANAKKRHPELSYAVVGYLGHRHLGEVQELARRLGVAESIRFFTDLTDEEMLQLYDRALFFMLTPVSQGGSVEGFGLVYREAGARGLAVIGSRGCGADDAVRDGETGILCGQEDVAAVSAAVEKLVSDAGVRARMGEAGRRLAAEETWAAAAKKYLAAYAEAMQRSK